MTEPRSVAIKPYFGGFVLETLTVGMYGESRNAIREYVQNAFDSIQDAIAEGLLPKGNGQIDIAYDKDGNGLTIKDNGAGLSAEIATATLTAVGASRKDYRTDAGFRGIGRLAGITFCDEMKFTTKVIGEKEETTVTFDAKKMRKMMSPEHGNDETAEAVLQKCVTATVSPAKAKDPGFFEVALRGWYEAPEECHQPAMMQSYLSQVAPVPYDADFPFAHLIETAAAKRERPLDTVRIVIEPVNGKKLDVTKPYSEEYEVADAPEMVSLKDIKIYSQFKHWWGWMGEKEVPGAFNDEKVRGVRVRAKNIQIDGSDVVAEIFRRFGAKSNERFQMWIVGEIFVDLSAVVPNARRDGFEETKAWTTMRREIAASICKDAATQAHSVSSQGQLTVEKLEEKSSKILREMESLRNQDFKNGDKTINVSAQITKLQGDVAKASRNADASTLAALNHIGSQISDLKVEAVSKIGGAALTDTEEMEIRDQLLGEIVAACEKRLELPCLSAMKSLLRDEFDFPPD